MLSKINKRLCAFMLSGALLFSASTTAFAANHSFSYSFGSTAPTIATAYYSKSDNDSNWYISIDKKATSTLSASNIMGCKMHRQTNDNVDIYHTFSNYVSSYPIAYSATVHKNDKMSLWMKKDSASTSNKNLIISGRFAP